MTETPWLFPQHTCTTYTLSGIKRGQQNGPQCSSKGAAEVACVHVRGKEDLQHRKSVWHLRPAVCIHARQSMLNRVEAQSLTAAEKPPGYDQGECQQPADRQKRGGGGGVGGLGLENQLMQVHGQSRFVKEAQVIVPTYKFLHNKTFGGGLGINQRWSEMN